MDSFIQNWQPKYRHMNKRIFYFLLLFLTVHFSSFGQTFPSEKWEINEQASREDWDQNKLNQLRNFFEDSTALTGMVIVHKGKIVDSYGDTKDVSYIASCRKSVLAMLYGKYVMSGEIDLDKTLADLNIDDVGGLSDSEKEATIQDIISARSGVFHAASNGGDFLALAPERGSKKAGEYWLYSNWDFNVAGYIFEKETGKNIYDEIENQFAKPLQMQDWDRSQQRKFGDGSKSKYQAYHMWFSARDLARLGLLMLNNGNWNGKQIIDPEWVEEMVKERSTYEELVQNAPPMKGSNFGYGYMWWLWNSETDPRLKGAYSAMGAWGQTISVFPAIDTVVAFKTNSAYGRSNSSETRMQVLKMAADAFKLSN